MYNPHRHTGQGLTRYGSAPGSLLTDIADSVITGDGEFSAVGSENMMGRYFSGDSSSQTSESGCRTNVSPDMQEVYRGERAHTGLQRSYGLHSEIAVEDFVATASNLKGGSSSGSNLIRHSSSPAGFFSHPMVDNAGFSVTRGTGNYSSLRGCNGGNGFPNGNLKSQLSFSRQDSLSQISEISVADIPGDGVAGPDDSASNIGQSYISGSFSMGSWDDTNSIVFSNPRSNRSKHINGDIVTGLNSIDSQFSLPKTSLEMGTVEKLLQIQQGSVPCKVRARRGCATHPRSIAERDRRGKISEKLRKLQELVPNMDKQTSYAEMLDLAVQHIKELQCEIEKLNQDRASCTCEGKQVKM
eukprot:TRINITY_DN5039_c0_g1_i1.p1 TRINITY_DN5039_c0_g1~~TRINITY_DN5039_c0_g1_i1.p1  ORF type:complete len:356 (-),score=30.68 TRINITY_DN5039_c0_g1_i1:64-1131(-)